MEKVHVSNRALCYTQNPCLDLTGQKAHIPGAATPRSKNHPTTFTRNSNNGLQFSPPPQPNQHPNAFTFPRNAFSQLAEDLSPLLHAGCSYFHCKPLQCVRNLKAHRDGEKTSERLWCPHTEHRTRASTTSSCTTSY